MKILYDGEIYSNQVAGGINRYFANIISRLPSDFTPSLIVESSPELNYPVHPNLKSLWWYKRFRPERLRILTDKLYSNAINKFNHFDLAHPTYYSLVTRQPLDNYKCPIVITVYDMIHELLPQQVPYSSHGISIKSKAIKSAQAIICISENTKKDLVNLYSIPEHKISVTYLAAEIDVSLSYGSEVVPKDPYYLYIGSRAKYKNFDRLLLAFAKTISAQSDLKLCVIGSPFNEKEAKRIAELKLGDHLENYGYVSDSHLAKLYRNSMALVYPSLYEGFGIPPLEAMSCQTAVIAANSSSLPEVVDDAGLLFNPESTDELAEQLIFLLNHPIERENLITKGYARSKLFTWEKTVAETIDVYRSLTESR
ncbi:glycosyl transferase group 1 [Rippkaea orientalis PCC 8801]|uniref:Glycosyl transferase group 1 n=1 Tax=Rippkaea orientalis (strain PCC 8801 / RF-1) TaxID=41431 RepID=B7JZJ8_RIPO1|nr:glycosyltransferase family 1 protein [Rippkaea orientalis]ACK64158.1 glycosyl transferase group 1 [Rippkaea orientalis PCC 8801]